MIKYSNIDDIKNDFGFQSDDILEIKKEVKVLLKDIHPDKNNDKFKNNLDEINFQKLTSALDYLNQDFAVIPKSEYTALTKIVTSSVSVKTEETQTKNLEDKIDKTIKEYKSSSFLPKISSSVIVSLLTFVWLFPSTVQNHPILSQYLSPNNIVFTIIWAYTILFTGSYCVIARRNEERLKGFVKKFNLETTQNKIFQSFAHIKSFSAKRKDEKYISFSKDELIEHFTNLDLNTLEYKSRRERKDLLSGIIFLRNKNIDLELAQTLTNIIIERAERKSIIQIEQNNSLSDTYRYEWKDEDEII